MICTVRTSITRRKNKEMRTREWRKEKYTPTRVPKPKYLQYEKYYVGDHRPKNKVQVLILPIYYKKDKPVVIDAAKQIYAVLKSGGYAAWVDLVNVILPGQRMRYWEEKGVQVRVEVGMKEAENGKCVVAVVKEVGSVAEKQTVDVDSVELLTTVKDAIGEPAYPPAPVSEAELAAIDNVAGIDRDDQAQNAARKMKHTRLGGDDEDDFDIGGMDAD